MLIVNFILQYKCYEYFSDANEDAIGCPVYDTSYHPPIIIDRVPKMPCLLYRLDKHSPAHTQLQLISFFSFF